MMPDNSNTEIASLLRLIDDPDETVHSAVMDRLRALCPQVIPDLTQALSGLSSDRARGEILDVIHAHQRTNLDRLSALIKQSLLSTQDLVLEEAVTLINGFGRPTEDSQSLVRYLDGLALRVHEVFITKTPANDLTHVMALQTVLYEEEGFTGAKEDYYAPASSYLTSVIDQRSGIPVSLAAIELMIADRVGLDLRGVAMPFHFLLYVPELGLYLDPVQHGTFVSRDDCIRFVQRSGLTFDQRMLDPVRNVDIVLRMLRNLALAHERYGEVWEAQSISQVLRDLGPQMPHH